jgi:hypothetical protein
MIRGGKGWAKSTMDETHSYDKLRLSIGTFPAEGLGNKNAVMGCIIPFKKR